MRSRRKEFTFEDAAAERDRALDGAEPDEGRPPPFTYDFSRPPPPMPAVREAVAPYGFDTSYADGYPTLVDRLLGRLRHALYTLDEQRDEIVRLRENTRQVLARLSAT
ncbi:MAG: hypothetical protein KY467_00890 [Gemmatimonadetes bacterium]|nr:hypothetical protein [Gemmatimonadota bacterium]